MLHAPIDTETATPLRASKLQRLLRPGIVVPGAVALVSLAELAVADRKYGVFTGGFGQSTAVDGNNERLAFLVGYLVAQALAALLAWKAAALLTRRAPGWPTLFHFAFAYVGLNLAALSAQYQLHSYFSDAVDFALLKQLGGGSLKDALLFGKNEIALGAAALGAFVLGWWVCWRIARRVLGAPVGSDAKRPRWRTLSLVTIAMIAALAFVPRAGGDVSQGLNRMLAWRGFANLAALATDFDRDGHGLFGLGRDTHPFDPARHPLALDVPGNGIDEDGYGGDLKLVPVPAAAPATIIGGHKPNVVLVVMESVRADVLGKRIGGNSVAPNLEAIAARGGSVAPAYSHVAFTTASLKSIFSGRLAPRPGDPSLFGELRASGYRVRVFSGQPEDFGDISATVAMRKNAQTFVDAETLKDSRAFSFAAQGSLLVDENLLLKEFDRHLGRAEAWREPQFVYFNFQSAHFPYDHSGVGRRLTDAPLPRGEISAANAAGVARTYWNAVAHADAALGELVARLKKLGEWDDTILLVTGDHGESLFEDGFLGHGHIINQRQFATFLVANRPLNAKPPIAISDYRAILLDLLGARPLLEQRFAPFMHIGELEGPSAIGLAGTRYGIVSLRLDTGLACFERSANCRRYADLTGDERAAADSLVARWGSERWAARKR